MYIKIKTETKKIIMTTTPRVCHLLPITPLPPHPNESNYSQAAGNLVQHRQKTQTGQRERLVSGVTWRPAMTPETTEAQLLAKQTCYLCPSHLRQH